MRLALKDRHVDDPRVLAKKGKWSGEMKGLVAKVAKPDWPAGLFSKLLNQLELQGQRDEIRELVKAVLLRALAELKGREDYPNCIQGGKNSEIISAAIFGARTIEEINPGDQDLRTVLAEMSLLDLFVLRDVSAEKNYLKYLKIGLALADQALPYSKGAAGREKEPSGLKKEEIALALLDDVLKHIRDGRIAVKPPMKLDDDEAAWDEYRAGVDLSGVDVAAFLRVLNHCSKELIEIVLKAVKEHDFLMFSDILEELTVGGGGQFRRILATKYAKRYFRPLQPSVAETRVLAEMGLLF